MQFSLVHGQNMGGFEYRKRTLSRNRASTAEIIRHENAKCSLAQPPIDKRRIAE